MNYTRINLFVQREIICAEEFGPILIRHSTGLRGRAVSLFASGRPRRITDAAFFKQLTKGSCATSKQTREQASEQASKQAGGETSY